MADLTITAASVLTAAGAVVKDGIAGATITAGQALYLDAAAGTLKLAQADGTAAEAAVVGVARHAALTGQPVSYVAAGPMNIGATTVKTTTYVLSALAGAICPQADLVSTNRIVRVGHASATDGTFILDVRNIGAVV